ncbi:MAG TPA: tetratricopeptide repeat protein [Pyrinomonadaceae bacterium]|nr:tetratricopeptide repeat protein [Pyrinomonadaceae bacterium]
MKICKTLSNVCLSILFVCLAWGASVAQQKPQPKGKGARKPTAAAQPAKARTAKARGARSEEELRAEFEALIKLPVSERIAGLRAFLEANPRTPLRTRATEHLVSAHAALGDERLQAQDADAGVELFKQAVALAPAEMSDKLYYEVVSQLPANLFLRGQAAAAIELARTLEAKAGADAKRLLAVAAFYVSVEQADEAARVAKSAITLAPELAAAHQALGAAHRLALRLEEATAAYARAVELDPRSAAARHSLADLRRATGKPEEALPLYRELLAANANDRGARNGLVLALFDAGKREEAERELEATLTSEPRNLLLLTGAAYWYAAHGEKTRALELAGQAVRIEPRFTWAQVALARAFIANKSPLDAERSLRFARQHGRFPTLDYELANALAAAGFYQEAFDELVRSFTLKDGQLETQLAGRTPARAASFIELLAPERRASIFQATPADTVENARMLKALLALNLALEATGEGSTIAQTEISAAANDFTSGTDEMRAFRQLYAAGRLLRRGVAFDTVLDLMAAARLNVEAATDAPEATAATTAEELRDVRAAAIAQGGTPDIPVLPRNAISNILRGRIEELTGMALLGQGKPAEAVAALRRAVSVLPERSLYWRTAQWRLGTALASGGQERDALAAYIKSYNPDQPDPARRAVIESLYTKVNGSTAGLEAQIGAAPARLATIEAVSATTSATPTKTPAADATPMTATPTETPAATVGNTPVANPTPDTSATPEPTPSSTPDASPVTTTPTPEASPSATPEASSTATPQPTPSSTSEATASPSPTPATSAPSPTPEPQSVNTTPSTKNETEATPTAEPTPAPSQSNAPAAAEASTEGASAPRARQKRASERANACTLALSARELELKNSGGAASVVVSLEGSDKLASINATTASWSDIIILREPQGSADTNSLKFTVTSISKTTGNFNVTFKSVCGTQELTVTVR